MATKDEILGVKTPKEENNAAVKANSSADVNLPTGQESPLQADSDVTGIVKDPHTSNTNSIDYNALLEEFGAKPKTKEEMVAEEKRYKRNQIFNAIGDGIMALSNLYFTTRGAPNMYTSKNTLSDRAKVRYDKLVKDNKDNILSYIAMRMKADKANADEAHRERSWQHKLNIDSAKESREKELHDLKLQFLNGQIDEQTYKANEAKIKSDYAERVQQSIIDKNKATASSSRASAEKYRKESKGEFIAYDADGKAHYFKNKDAAEAFARQNNTWEDISTTSTQEKSEGKSKTTTTTTKVTSGRAAKPKKKNPML